MLSFLLTGSLFYGTQGLPLRDYRETRFAELGRETLIGDDWIVPHLNGSPYLNKPPLVPWTVALSYIAFGVGEGAARLPSLVAILWTALVVGWITRRIFGKGVGIVGAVLFLGTPGTHYYGRMLMSDTIAMASMLTAVAAFLEGYLSERTRWYRLGFLACGLAVLSRGLIGIIYPLVAMVIFLVIVDRRALTRIPWFSGGIVFLAVTVPWFVAVELKYPGFLFHQMVQQQIERFMSHGTQVFVAIPRWQILLSFAGFLGPLALGLPWALGTLSGERASHRLMWILGLLVLCSVMLSSGRNHPYTLPAIPPMVILAAGWLVEVSNRPSPFSYRAPALLIGLLGIIVLACLPWVGKILPGCSPLLDDATTRLIAQLALAMVAFLALAAWVCLWQGKVGATCLALAAIMIPGAWMLVNVQDRMAPLQSRADLARLVAREVPSSWPIVVADPKDRQFEGTGGWGFYARRRVLMVAFEDSAAGMLQEVSRPKWILDVQAFSKLWESGKPFCLAATKEALSRFRLSDLPSSRAEDGRFTLFMIPKRDIPGRAGGPFGERALQENRATLLLTKHE